MRARWSAFGVAQATAAGVVIGLCCVVAAQAPPRVNALRLYVLDCGTLMNRDAVPYGLSREQAPPRALSDSCALIAHPRGTLLWDTGVNMAVNDIPLTLPAIAGQPRPGDRLTRTLSSQLMEIGYTPSAITYLSLSHSHWDHTGNVRDYAASTWLVQKAERDLIFGEPPIRNRADFAGMEKSRTEIVNGDHDVFGDGSVMLLSTPGHTPGHQSLLVKLRNTGPVILSGDLYHFPEEVTLTATLPVPNADQIAASSVKVQALVKDGAQLWIQHDMRGYASLKKAPAFYD